MLHYLDHLKKQLKLHQILKNSCLTTPDIDFEINDNFDNATLNINVFKMEFKFLFK